jgi:hypothetical protein
MKIMGENSWTKRDRTTGKIMPEEGARIEEIQGLCREKVPSDGFDAKARSNNGAH